MGRRHAIPSDDLDLESKARLVFMYRLGRSYAHWVRSGNVSLGFPECNIWIGALKETTADLDMTDEQFECVDRVIARIHRESRRLFMVEFFIVVGQDAKATRFDVHRNTFKRRVDELLMYIFDLLKPDVLDWFEAVL